MIDVLSRICEAKRADVARRRTARPLAEVEAAAARAPAPRGFIARLNAARAQGRTGLVGEIKKASPSKGLIRADFDPPALARAYAEGGATCLSVLTDTPYFQGADEHLIAARAAVDLPVLRKDFTLDRYQVAEARALGADCVLLILAALSDDQAASLEANVHALGMDALIEVHDGAELERALALSSPLIGINNRDLKTLEVDLATTERLAPMLPPERLAVSESGLYTAGDLARLERAGVGCFLVGESLMRQEDVAAATAALLAGPAPQARTA
jgi:indole-3-glycerol phosphate synthase